MPATVKMTSGMRPPDVLARFKVILDEDNWPALQKMLEALSQEPGVIAATLPNIIPPLLERAPSFQWLDTLLAPSSRLWLRLPVLGKLGVSLVGSSAFVFFAERLTARAGTKQRVVTMAGDHFRNYHEDVISLLLPLKYPGLARPDTSAALFEAAELLAPEIEGNLKSLDRLFERRADRTVDRKSWEKEVRLTRALEHLIRDFNLSVDFCLSLFSDNSKDVVLDALSRSKGTILTLHHGGVASMRAAFLENIFPDAVYFTNNLSFAHRISIDIDAAGAMLEALRHAMKGRIIGISPDGPKGADGPQINVLGGQSAVRAGAAMLAFEAKVGTAWFAVGRQGREFYPILRLGPKPESGETYMAFQSRFMMFYETCMNEYFAGDPQNLLLNTRWIKYLADLPPVFSNGDSRPLSQVAIFSRGADRP